MNPPEATVQHPAPFSGPLLAPQEQRTWAMLAHLGGMVLPILPALIIFVYYNERGPFLRRHSLEALNFQVSLLIYTAAAMLASTVLAIVTLGVGLLLIVPLLVIAWVVALIFMVLAAVAANHGREYRYPLGLQLLH